MFEDEAQKAITAVRQQRPHFPPGYEPAALTAADRAEAEKAKNDSKLCGLCAGVHALPSSAACPRLVSFELNGDGSIKSGTFRTDTKWQSRVVLAEDLAEEGDDGG
ncbi:MAG: hypothetical protein WA766_21535 [Candidatus Acidiferrales bacterium]